MMTKFLPTASGGLINAECMERIENERDERGVLRAVALAKDGERVEPGGDVREIKASMLPIVAATPGYTALQYIDLSSGGGPSGVARSPIVAWRVDGDSAWPIMLEASPNDVDAGVLMPDGRVIGSLGQTFDEEAVWSLEMGRRAEEKRADAER